MDRDDALVHVDDGHEEGKGNSSRGREVLLPEDLLVGHESLRLYGDRQGRGAAVIGRRDLKSGHDVVEAVITRSP